MLNQEILTIKLKLDFSDDPFKTYTCQAKNSQGEILAKTSMRIRNWVYSNKQTLKFSKPFWNGIFGPILAKKSVTSLLRNGIFLYSYL